MTVTQEQAYLSKVMQIKQKLYDDAKRKLDFAADVHTIAQANADKAFSDYMESIGEFE